MAVRNAQRQEVAARHEAARAAAEAHLREAWSALSPARAQEVREAYFKAAEGLEALHALLAEASREVSAEHYASLASEQIQVRAAREKFDQALLGRIA